MAVQGSPLRKSSRCPKIFLPKKLGARIGCGASAEGVKPLAAGGPGAA